MGAPDVRVAVASDATVVGRLLHDFNAEYDTPTPAPAVVAARIAELMAGGDTAVLLGSLDGDGPQGLAVLRFRGAIFSDGLESYLAELYVVPDRRGQGLGKALMRAVLHLAEQRGADSIDLGTSADDTAAMALYRRMGFTNREGGPDGPVMFVFERELPRGCG